MDLNGAAKLLTSIAMVYPSFKKNIMTDDNKIDRRVGEEWLKRIGYLDYEEADRRFTEYLNGPDSKYAPGITYFLQYKDKPKTEIKLTNDGISGFHIINGNLFDSEEREYGNADCMPYYYNAYGNICRKNLAGDEVVIVR